MSSEDEHQVGITNAQEKNPDAVIADLTRRMNGYFAAGRIQRGSELSPCRSRHGAENELRDTFVRHGVTVLASRS